MGFFFLFALNCKVVYNEKMTQLSPLVLHYLLWDGEGVDNEYIYIKRGGFDVGFRQNTGLVLITCLRQIFTHSTEGSIKYVKAEIPLNY